MATYLKHYWTDNVGNYQTVRNQSVDRRHPNIDGISVKYWLKDERGVDYCLSMCSDTTLIDTPPVGIQVLTRQEWDAIVATIPPPPEAPVPQWETFRSTLASSPAMIAILTEAVTVAPQAVVSLTSSVYQLDTNNFSDFQNAWNEIKNAVVIPEEVKQQFGELAQSCNLPGEFVSIIAS